MFALVKETGDWLLATAGDWDTRIHVDPDDVVGLNVRAEEITWVFGIDVPNPAYRPEGAPYYDDIDNDGVADIGEPVFSERHLLWDANDWRSTFVEKYYRRADNNGFPAPEEIAWDAATPKLLSGVALVPRNFRPRLNAYRYGRPNLVVNLLVAFSPPEFFDGAHGLNAQTRVNPFMVLAITSLILDSVHTAEAVIDFDGPGPMPAMLETVPAHFFVPPVGDPVQMIVDGFGALAEAP